MRIKRSHCTLQVTNLGKDVQPSAAIIWLEQSENLWYVTKLCSDVDISAVVLGGAPGLLGYLSPSYPHSILKSLCSPDQ